ncbi:ATP-binding protein [Kitasatospora sp. NPDC096077]|uniref:ATP-binding protein n=1 Tax=Kitasatospora sp. NPDC096077 TaxID=3155544 RepID=UPI003320F47B
MCAFTPPDWSPARSELSDLLASAGWPPSLISDADFALHELVVNAWEHAASPAPLCTFSLSPARLRVLVCDDSPVFPPEPRLPADPFATSGRGLHLVRALTHRFGVDPRKHGKVVWFEMEPHA